jgi:hypothetical protein
MKNLRFTERTIESSESWSIPPPPLLAKLRLRVEGDIFDSLQQKWIVIDIRLLILIYLQILSLSLLTTNQNAMRATFPVMLRFSIRPPQ